MNVPTYTAAELAPAFGDNYSGADAGVLIPVNALHSFSEELSVLSMVANEDHRDFEIVLIRMARRMELVAEIGHTEILALAARVADLEAQLAKASGSESTAAQ